MATPDNRIRFSATRIDFAADVGDTGQDHDEFPAPGGQARYDWMRSYLIGLLANQASYDPPTQYREGTPWFDLNVFALKIRSGDEWVSLANAIAVTEPDSEGQIVSLATWYDAVQAAIGTLSPELVFSGVCNADDITTIEIPESLQSQLASDSRVFLYINGALVSPNSCSLIGSPTPTTIKLNGVSLSADDNFTVQIRRIGTAYFVTTTVTIP